MEMIAREVSDHSDERTVGYMLANNTALVQMVEPVMEEMLATDGGDQFRRDLRPKDLAQFFISTSISMLLDAARRYIDVFVLPAIVAHPPHPRPVFPGADDES